MKKVSKRRSKVAELIMLCLFVVLALVTSIFMYFGGFGTGESGKPEEFAAYAGKVEDISIPESVRIIALGEASHGNVEFQQLKMDVFRLLVENYSVCAFALEGDYGGCEQVNRYIHGGQGTAREAAAAIGFDIYRTEEMEQLILFMRQYNDSVADDKSLRFYGIDMQRYNYSFTLLMEECQKLDVNFKNMEKIMDGADWSDEYDIPARVEIITDVKNELEGVENAAQAIHLTDMLLQYFELQGSSEVDYSILRDRYLAQNTQWIAEQERETGYERIFITGHNGHVAKWSSYDSMGKLLANDMGDSYYVIGTDFYKTSCNMPSQSSGRRTNHIFYSHNPLAKTAQMAGLDICWLDFAKACESLELTEMISQYTYMGSLGEGFAWYMRLLPQSYRLFQPPADLYDGMIFVAKANPITIIREESVASIDSASLKVQSSSEESDSQPQMKIQPESWEITLFNKMDIALDLITVTHNGMENVVYTSLLPGESTSVHWDKDAESQTYEDRGGRAPCFTVSVGGRIVQVDTLRIVGNDNREELVFDFAALALFREGEEFFLSPQLDYTNLQPNLEQNLYAVSYRYLPQVQRWLQMVPGQLLFAVGLEENEFQALFPNFEEDIPEYGVTAIICIEEIYLQDITVEVDQRPDYPSVTETKKSDTVQVFTPDDVMVIRVDHVRGPYMYYYYKDSEGGVHRQYVQDQFRDGNNGGIINTVLTGQGDYYTIIPA